jgi:drug/metabolite transporter (DMT)-like permease
MPALPPTTEAPLLSLDAKVALLGLLNAVLMTGGTFFQKLNSVRAGNPVWSGWLVAACICFFPTFWIANFTYAIGGRVSVFVPMSAAMYVLVTIIGRLAFGESVGSSQVFGCLLIVAGVALIARA